jgi:hypothetical protein
MPPRARPAGVPEEGFWNDEIGQWEVSRTDARGARTGACAFYRPDGTLFLRCAFVEGLQQGPFTIHHGDGRVAREGAYDAGQIDGQVIAYASDGPGAEPLRACCVPPAATRLAARYRAGELLQEIFYDGTGTPILSDGQPWPPRPDAVPGSAEYDEGGARWALRTPVLERFWTPEGRLVEEVEHGQGRVARQYDADGDLALTCRFDAEGQLDGPFLRRLPPGAPGPYADARIVEERGAYAGGQAVGRWSFADRQGAVVRTVERGARAPAEELAASAVFGAAPPAADASWRALAARLRGEGRVREALVAAARASGEDGDETALRAALAADVVGLVPALEAERGAALAQAGDASPASILEALVAGADPAAALAALAAVLPAGSPAARELVEVALRLAPERRMLHLTRGLIRLQRGDAEGALDDARLVEAESPGAAESLRQYARASFRAFDFWPAREPLVVDPELAGLPTEVAQDAASIRRAAGVYATRIERAREALAALRGPGAPPAWFPPRLDQLLPAGPLALRHETMATDGDEGGGAVELDERVVTAGLDAPALAALAHADWSALAWMCWSVGLDRVALPDAIEPPPTLPSAMKMAVVRCWRARDRLTTGGLVARAGSVPGFSWEGADIDALPPHLVQQAAAEYLAIRSMFLWLSSPDAASPFQSDLRDA